MVIHNRFTNNDSNFFFLPITETNSHTMIVDLSFSQLYSVRVIDVCKSCKKNYLDLIID